MWKYRCKSHLLSLFISFVVGFILGVISLWQGSEIYATMYPSEVVQFIEDNPYLVYIMSGISIAGIVNIVRLTQLAGSKWNMSPFIVVILVFFLPDLFLLLGIALLVPAILVSIVGIIQLYREKKNYGLSHPNSDDEIVRLYEINHPLHEEYQCIGQACKKNSLKIKAIYLLGIVAATFVLFLVNNMTFLILIFMVFVFSFNIILKYKATNELPILSLLVQNCDPEACASAIIYYSQSKYKTHLKMHVSLAQCLIYMDDPELAQDVLALMPRKDRNANIQYWTLMSYIYYLLKDEKSLERCKEELAKLNGSLGLSSVFIPSEEMGTVQNKLNLMNGDLNTCKKYYLSSLQRARFPFQQVDSAYYIALISYVQEDYPVAEMYFKKVVDQGNRMCFVKKAQVYLDKLEQIQFDQQA